MDNSMKTKVALSAIVVLVGLGVIAYTAFGDKQQERKTKAVEAPVIGELPEGLELEGNYSCLMISGSDTTSLVALVGKAVGEGYQMTLISEYEPRIIFFKRLTDTRLMSEELGMGEVTYKQNIEKTTISFEKENLKCVLSK